MNKILRGIACTLLSCSALCFAACNASSGASASQPASTSTPVKEGQRVYFAAPLFSQAEQEYNLKITHILEEHEYSVFLPQRDGFLAAELEGLSEDEKAKKIFAKDCQELLAADIFFGILDGRAPDEGVCVELGIAYSNQKRCYGFKTDARTVEEGMNLNPMIAGCLDQLFYDINGDAAIASLVDYLEHNKL